MRYHLKGGSVQIYMYLIFIATHASQTIQGTQVVQKNHATNHTLNVNATNKDGYSSLMQAAALGDLIVIEQLIDAGADINAINKYGLTALMMAVWTGNIPLVEPLVAAGANPEIKNEKAKNKTARDYAKDKLEYDKAVSAGLEEQKIRQAYKARQAQSKKIIEEQSQLIPNISDIITEYAYGPLPSDLPEKDKARGCVVQ